MVFAAGILKDEISFSGKGNDLGNGIFSSDTSIQKMREGLETTDDVVQS